MIKNCFFFLKSSQDLAVQWRHDLLSAGHQGRQRTKQRVKEIYTWYGLSKFVEQYVAGFDPCNKYKKYDRRGRGSVL